MTTGSNLSREFIGHGRTVFPFRHHTSYLAVVVDIGAVRRHEGVTPLWDGEERHEDTGQSQSRDQRKPEGREGREADSMGLFLTLSRRFTC